MTVDQHRRGEAVASSSAKNENFVAFFLPGQILVLRALRPYEGRRAGAGPVIA